MPLFTPAKAYLNPLVSIERLLIWDFDDTLAVKPPTASLDTKDEKSICLATQKIYFNNQAYPNARSIILSSGNYGIGRIEKYCAYHFTPKTDVCFSLTTRERDKIFEGYTQDTLPRANWDRLHHSKRLYIQTVIKNKYPHLRPAEIFFTDDDKDYLNPVAASGLVGVVAKADAKGSHFNSAKTFLEQKISFTGSQERTKLLEVLTQALGPLELKQNDHSLAGLTKAISKALPKIDCSFRREFLRFALQFSVPGDMPLKQYYRLLHQNLAINIAQPKFIYSHFFLAIIEKIINHFDDGTCPDGFVTMKRRLKEMREKVGGDDSLIIADLLTMITTVACDRLGSNIFLFFVRVLKRNPIVDDFYMVVESLPKLLAREDHLVKAEDCEAVLSELLGIHARLLAKKSEPEAPKPTTPVNHLSTKIQISG